MQIFRDTALAGANLNEQLPHTWVIDNFVVNKDMSTSMGIVAEVPAFFTYSEGERNAFHSQFRSFLNSLPPTISVQLVWEVFRDTSDINQRFNDAISLIGNSAEKEYTQSLQVIHDEWQRECVRRERRGEPVPPEPDYPEFSLSDSQELSCRYIAESRTKWGKFAETKCLRRYRVYIILTLAPYLDNIAWMNRGKAEVKKIRADSIGLYPKATVKDFFTSLFSTNKDSPVSKAYTPIEWDEIKGLWAPIIDSLFTTLDALNFSGRRLEENDIVGLLYRMWNPKTANTIGCPDVSDSPLAMLPEMYLSDSVSIDKRGGTFYTDNCSHKILSLETPASVLDVNIFAPILEEQFIPNLHVVINIQPYDRAKRVAELQKELPLLMGRVSKDPKLQVAIDQIRGEVYNLQQSQEGCWRAAVYFHTWGDNNQEVEQYCTELKRLGRVCGNSTIISESLACWRYWVAMQPFWGRDTDTYRHFHISSTQLCCLVPITGHFERLGPSDELAMLLESANASVFNYNPMDNGRLNNYNTLISGGSGTGKSFLAGSILLNMKLKGARVICVDIGASYKSLCEAFHGEYITMDASSKSQTLNPLARPKDGNSAAARFNAIRWLEVALLDKGQIFEKDLQSDLDNALSQLYNKFTNTGSILEPTLSDLRQLLANFENPKIQNLVKRLDMYCSGGQHGALFDGQTKINLDNPFLVFDLTLIKDHPDLGPLTLMSVMANVERMASNFPKEPKVLLLDEAWALLNNEAGAKFVVEAFRTYRKLNVAILGISQEVADWTGGHLRGVVSNVSTYFVLTQANSGTLAQAANIVGFTEEEVAIAGSLSKEKGKYAQALFIQKCQGGRFSTVIVNRTTPLQYALMTTDGRDRAEIQRIMERENCSNLAARLIFAEKYPNGV